MKTLKGIGTAISWIAVAILVLILLTAGIGLGVFLLAGAILGVVTHIAWWVVKVVAKIFGPTSAIGAILFALMVIGVALLLFGGGLISAESAHLGFQYQEAAANPEIMSQYSAEELAEAGTVMLTFSAIVGGLVIAGWFIGFFAPFWDKV